MRVLEALVLASSLLIAGSACKRAIQALDETGAVQLMTADAFTEQNALGSLSLRLLGDGKARLLVRSPAGEVVKGGVDGELSFAPTDDSAPPRSVKLVQDPASGLLEADGVELGSELTEVKYALTVSGKPLYGSVALPKGGTRELAASAEGSVAASGDAGPAAGPHGGVVEVIHGEKYEVVADADSKQVRVYPLTVKTPPRTVKLHVDGDEPRVVVLERAPEAEYYVAPLVVKTHPKKLTLLVVDHHGPGVVVVGWHPRHHHALVVHQRPVYWVHRGWHVKHDHHDHHDVLVVKDHPHKLKVKHASPGHGKKHKH